MHAVCRRYTLPGWHKWPTAAESRGALILPMGTIESTKDRAWTWILQSPVADVIDAGVDFDPEVRTVRASQGDAVTGGALEVRPPAINQLFNQLIHPSTKQSALESPLKAQGIEPGLGACSLLKQT